MQPHMPTDSVWRNVFLSRGYGTKWHQGLHRWVNSRRLYPIAPEISILNPPPPKTKQNKGILDKTAVNFVSRCVLCSPLMLILCLVVFMFTMIDADFSDLNECETPSTCSQICTDTKGSYKCECDDMYELMPDRRTCKASSKWKLRFHTCVFVIILKIFPDQFA